MWLVRRPAAHSQDLREFVESSQLAGRKQVRVKVVGAVATIIALATVAGLAGVWGQQSNQRLSEANLNMQRALEVQEAAVLEEKRATVTARRAHVGLALQAARAVPDPLQAALALKDIPVGAPAPPGGVVAARAVLDRSVPYQVIAEEGRPVLAFSPTLDRVVRIGATPNDVQIVRSEGGSAVDLEAHDSPVVAASFSPDGQSAATGSADGTVRVWAATGEGTSIGLLPPPDLVGKPVVGLAFTDDSGHVVVRTAGASWLRSADGSGDVWSVPANGEADATGSAFAWADGDSLFVAKRGAEPVASELPGLTAFAWSPRSKVLGLGFADGAVAEWSQSGEPKERGRLSGPVQAVAWGAGGDRLAAASDRQRVVWTRGQQRGVALNARSEDADAVASLAFAERGEWLVARDRAGRVDVHRVGEDGVARVARTRLDTGHDAVRYAGLSPSRSSAKVAAIAPDGSARFWRLETRHGDFVMRGSKSDLRSVALSPDARWVAAETKDGNVLVWRRGRPNEAGHLLAGRRSDKVAPLGDPQAESRLRFDPEGKRLFLARNDGSALGWTVEDWQPDWQPQSVAGTVWSRIDPTGSWQVLATADGALSVRATSEGGLTRELGSHRRNILAARFAPTTEVDKATLVTGSEDWQVGVWPLKDGGVSFLEGHRDRVVAVDVTADGKRALSASADGTTRLWDLAEKTEVHRVEGVGAVSDARFGARGERAIVMQAGAVVAWATRDAAELGRWSAELHGGADAMEISPDGERVAVQTADGGFTLLTGDGFDGSIDLRGDGLEGGSMQYDPTGQWLVAAAKDHTLRVYAVGWKAAFAAVHESTNACLDAAARHRIFQQTRAKAEQGAARCREG